MRRLILLLTVLAAALCGCGVSTQSGPETITVRPHRVSVWTPPSSGPVPYTVFFVHHRRLQAVQRGSTTTGDDLRQVLSMLAVGPSQGEVRSGMRSALPSQPISGLGVDEHGVLTLGVPRQFTEVAGNDQLLAVAQVVWTVSQFPWVKGVRFVVGHDALEVPTDQGLVQRTVTRADYRTVAPRTVAPRTAPASGTPAPPT